MLGRTPPPPLPHSQTPDPPTDVDGEGHVVMALMRMSRVSDSGGVRLLSSLILNREGVC